MSVAPTPPPQNPPFPNPPQRQGTQPPGFTVGIAAGAEDVKYQAKYKDLKRKVKEIEADNDKLHFKVLQAKRSIQRMKLERAVLYERLQQVPPSPEMHDRHPLPPVHPQQPHPSPHQVSQQQHHALPPNHHPRDIDRTPPEYIRTHSGSLGREGPTTRDRERDRDHPIPPAHLNSRRGSLGGPPGQVQFMQHLSPVQPDPHGRDRGHPQRSPHMHTSPHMQQHPHPHASQSHQPHQSHSSHGGHSHSHERSPSRSRHPGPGPGPGPGAPPIYHPQYPDVPPAPLHSPPLSDRERRLEARSRHDMPPHHQNSMPPQSPSASSDARGRSGAVHNHQRIGPGTYLNREERGGRSDRGDGLPDRETWERESMAAYAQKYEAERAARRREDVAAAAQQQSPPSYYPPTSRPVYSRSNSVGSGSASGSGVGEERADSREFYERERERDVREREREREPGPAPRTSFRLRPVAQTAQATGDEVDFVHEDGRQPPQVTSARESMRESMREERDRERENSRNGKDGGYAPPPAEAPTTRKRGRNDMDVDDEGDGGPPYASSSRHDDREPRGKRYHPSSDRM